MKSRQIQVNCVTGCLLVLLTCNYFLFTTLMGVMRDPLTSPDSTFFGKMIPQVYQQQQQHLKELPQETPQTSQKPISPMEFDTTGTEMTPQERHYQLRQRRRRERRQNQPHTQVVKEEEVVEEEEEEEQEELDSYEKPMSVQASIKKKQKEMELALRHERKRKEEETALIVRETISRIGLDGFGLLQKEQLQSKRQPEDDDDHEEEVPFAFPKGSCVTTFNREDLPTNERGVLMFTAPPPLSELPVPMQTWKTHLSGIGTLVVFANDQKTAKVARDNDIPLICLEHVDEKLPRFDVMMKRMHEAQTHGIVGFVNSDIEVENFDEHLQFFRNLANENLPTYRPTSLYNFYEPTGLSSPDWFAVVTRLDVSMDGSITRHDTGGFDLWAWNRYPGGPPLLTVDIPPFRFPYATYDNWLLDIIVQLGERNVFDCTETVRLLHHEHLRIGGSKTWYDALQAGVTGVFVNRHLGYRQIKELPARLKHVAYHWKFGTSFGTPYYTRRDAQGNINIKKRIIFSNESPSSLEMQDCFESSPSSCENLAELIETNTITKRDETADIPYSTAYSPQQTRGKTHTKKQTEVQKKALKNWRYTMEEQLKQHANEDGFVMLSAVNYGYRLHLMNFKCGLERVGMLDHFVIGALDDDMYNWGIMRGLPIFRVTLDSSHTSDAAYGSDAFKKLTKLKSKLVLQVLEAGYSVVWSDVDITWFVHPFEVMSEFMIPDGGIAIQSNAPYVENENAPANTKTATGGSLRTEDPAAFRRLNSGLYVAPNNENVISAFRAITEHASRSKLSEQPSFDAILCEDAPSQRHITYCSYIREPSSEEEIDSYGSSQSMKVTMLDQMKYPNGAILVGQQNENVYEIGRDRFQQLTNKRLFCAHNNWITGEDKKYQRQVDRGWWFLDDDDLCRYHGTYDPPQ